jgi:hypothetical protein
MSIIVRMCLVPEWHGNHEFEALICHDSDIRRFEETSVHDKSATCYLEIQQIRLHILVGAYVRDAAGEKLVVARQSPFSVNYKTEIHLRQAVVILAVPVFEHVDQFGGETEGCDVIPQCFFRAHHFA